jgi:hypothetical protein
MSSLGPMLGALRKGARRLASPAGALGVGALLVAVLVDGTSRLGLASDGPVLQTDHSGYVAGQPVTIIGAGFVPFDSVTLQVSHADGTAESGMGHEARSVSPDQDGGFTATWSVDPMDAAGNGFVATASGSASGDGAPATFSRMAVIQTDKFDYLPNDMVLITGAGFLPGETVTLEVSHVSGLAGGVGHGPFTVVSDDGGQIATTWFVDPDDSLGSILALTAVGSTSGLSALAFFTDTLVTIVDTGGPDDQPGQKDLNLLAVDNGNLPTSEAISWNWDDTDWSGNNTGDGCSLFDTDADGKANFSLCVTVAGSPATYQSTRLYSCGDARSDRCDQPTTLIASFTSTCNAAVVANSDPFGVPASPYYAPSHVSGNTCKDTPGCYTADTVAACTVRLADFGDPTKAFLVNVCTYPSQEPNSDPSDCVVTPNDGFLTIVKQANPSDATTFTFNLGAGQQSDTTPPVSSWSINGSGSVVLIPFLPGTSYDLSEVVPAGWDLESASCAIQTEPATPSGTETATGVNDFEIRSGLETVCTFSDSLLPGSLTVIKHVVNDNGGTAVASDFTIDLGGTTGISFPGAESPGTTKSFAAGTTFNVTETGPAGYAASYSGDCSGTIQAGVDKTCRITNDDEQAYLTLVKTVVNDNGGSAVADDFARFIDGGAVSWGVAVPVNPGGHTASETPLAGYTASAWGGDCAADGTVSIALGENKTCRITNDDQPGTIIVKKIVKGTTTNTSFAFDTTGAGYAAFSLSNGDENSQTLDAGAYSVTEMVPLGWVLTGIGGSSDPATPYDCTVTGSGGSTGTGDLDTQTATISLKNGDTVTCVFENTGPGVTRTQGFWATHPQLAQIAWDGGSAFGHTFPGVSAVAGIGDQLICGRLVDSTMLAGDNELMGGFWSGIPKTSMGTKRSSLDQSRMQLLQQLLAAELNASAFGSVPSGGTGEFAQWEAALCGTSTKKIQAAQKEAASFNSQGDSSTFTPGTSADSKYARALANIPFWDIVKP